MVLGKTQPTKVLSPFGGELDPVFDKRLSTSEGDIYEMSDFVLAPPNRDGSVRIVIGKDRVDDKTSGFGGIVGHSHCYTIDLVAGCLGRNKIDLIPTQQNQEGVYSAGNLQFFDEDGDGDFDGGGTSVSSNLEDFVSNDTEKVRVYSSPSPLLDAARIKISQKSLVDVEYKLFDTYPDQLALQPRSYVAAAADGIRIMSKDAGIKLVTGIGEVNSVNQNMSDSSNHRGVYLVGNNKHSNLQPMVLGDNLKELLQSMLKSMNNISSTIDNFIGIQMQINSVLGAHTHLTNAPSFPTAPSIEAGIVVTKSNIDNVMHTLIPSFQQRIRYFATTVNSLLKGQSGDILSSYHKLN